MSKEVAIKETNQVAAVSEFNTDVFNAFAG